MKSTRGEGLLGLVARVAGLVLVAVSFTAAQQPPPPSSQNPFESVPQTGQQSPFEQVQPPEQPQQQTQTPDVIEAIEFRGARRVTTDMLRSMIFTQVGDVYNEEALHRDFMALWNSGRFDDITLVKERGDNGWIIRFRLVERRVIRSINYEGMKSVQVSDVLDRFKDRRVGLSVGSQYDPATVQRAAVVLKEFLAERGRQFATVEPDLTQMPPSSLELVFRVNEGPKVKVGKLDFVGNSVFTDNELIRSMKLLKPIGIPYSIYFEHLFAKSYDENKLLYDKELVSQKYRNEGYYTSQTLDHSVNIRDVGGGRFRIPLIYPNSLGKKADVTINVEEGPRFTIRNINFEGVNLFRTPQALMTPLFGLQQGSYFSAKRIQTGIENMQNYYGTYGYIDAVAVPDIQVVPNTNQLDITLSVDEGQQFFVRRIDFSGNTTTRDKVIRRELLLDEGDIFNKDLWKLSILRLNQLGYFEALKEDEAADIRRDTRNNTVDITLSVTERGRNTVQMNGGVSGLAGTFVGLGYSTNNFLGLGETLSLDAQLGDRLQSVTFGFTEPYLFDRPIQAGFTVNTSRFDFNQGREYSILANRDLRSAFASLGSENLLNYVTQGYGFSVFASYPLRRSFARVSMTYGYDNQDIKPVSDAATTYFQYLNFQGLDGPNSLVGIRTSRVVPAYSYNTVDHPITPSRGQSIYVSTTFAGLGGNVKMIQPTIDYKRFRRGFKLGHVIGFHGLARLVSGYGGVSAPPFNRFYMGGENDIRGFNIWGISPVAWVPTSTTVPVLNNDGTPRYQKVLDADGNSVLAPVGKAVPGYQIIFPGGDLSLVGNFEYRIPIGGPVTLALFLDAGINRVIFPSQLKLNSGRLAELNSQFPQASFDSAAVIARDTMSMRSSTGVEFQIMMPMVNAPFRVYYAYNPNVLRTTLQKPIVVDRSFFPNQSTFINAVAGYGQPQPWNEDKTTFRFTISRTF